jgi:integrase
MAQTIRRLTDVRVRSAKAPGLYADGGGLYFRIAPGGSRGWIFRFTLDGRARDMGLGSYPRISLEEARRKAQECRELVAEGIDPIDRRRDGRAARRAAKAQEQAAAARRPTFSACMRGYIQTHQAEWGSAKHARQWLTTMERYVLPRIGAKPVAEVDQADVLAVLEPHWRSKPETLSRVRGRLEVTLGWAKARGFRSGDNPAEWVTLKHLLPKKSRLRRVQHYAALPYTEIGAFMQTLRASTDLAARCLEFTILTATRTNEVRSARWGEIDFDSETWTIPGARMKTGREHRVPLSAPAVELLARLHAIRIDDEHVFPGRWGGALSDGAMLMLLERLGRGDITVHGFRSTFRDWAGEVSTHPNFVVEMALAHTVPSAVEGAYRRGDLFAKRRVLMAEWSKWCAAPRGEVSELGAARRSRRRAP